MTTYGTAGGGLTNATWAANADVARIGRVGEQRTARLLERVIGRSENAPTVLHDLRIPDPRYKANIDHVVVSGKTVYIVDTKVWASGFYWTLGGRSFRGLSRFGPAEKRTMPLATATLASHLRAHGVRARIERPILVVWPSSKKGTPRLTWLRVPGARVMTAERFEHYAKKAYGHGKPADPRIVNALLPLLNRSAAA